MTGNKNETQKTKKKQKTHENWLPMQNQMLGIVYSSNFYNMNIEKHLMGDLIPGVFTVLCLMFSIWLNGLLINVGWNGEAYVIFNLFIWTDFGL